ncbi:MAG: 16S rRNA (cytidine(1402)-2'-O)-methyltransferase [Armatimonadetes bacterium]|nr:16S rRNA (cytidine(1402)-2'-O)-methyltransferase [Armatimonadota bacterium]
MATPIGNLEDITLRALRVLKEVDVIAAEDTRVTRKLLSHYDIHTQMVAYHQHSSGRRAEEIVDMIKAGATVALVSDAGTPGISDPGHELIALCIAADLPIQSVPGPAALIPAIVVSGLSTSHFIFDGFPPRKLSERRTYFKSIADETRTIVLYESPLRLSVTLRTIKEVLGDRQVAVIREATKLFEEVFRGDVSEAIERFQGRIRGEIVLVIEGGIPQTNTNPEEVQPLLRRRLAELLASGLSQRDAVRQGTIELRLPRRLVYATMLAMKENGDEIDS